MKRMESLFGSAISRRGFIAAMAAGMASAAMDCTDWTRTKALAAAVEPKSAYPVVVIGAGMGGLTAAAYLARSGFPVTVIEQHDTPGGYATSFGRAGGEFVFEVSPHYTVGAGQYLEDLGIKEKVELIALPEYCRVVTPDYDLIFPQQNPKEIIGLLSEKFAQEAEGIRGFIGQLMSLMQELRQPIEPKTMASTHPTMWGMSNQTVAQFMNKYVQDSKLKAILFALGPALGLPPWKLPALAYAGGTAPYMVVGKVRIKGYARDASLAFIELIQKHGGRIILKSEVQTILTREGGVVGVKTADGNTYRAKAVVSNASAPATFEKMLSPGVVPDGYMVKLRTYRPSISSIKVWLGLKEELRGRIRGYQIAVSDAYDLEASHEAALAVDASKAPFGVFIYDNVYSGYSKPGKSVVSLVMPCGYEPWKKFEADYFAGRKEAYRKEKDLVVQMLIDRTEARVIPGLKSMIEVVDAATPLTNMRYTRNPEGAIVGYESSMSNFGMTRIKNRTPVKGLYLAGHWGEPGGGFVTVMRSGQNTFKMMMEDWGQKTS